ncbi:transmembrane protein 62 [Penaeus vannamei]|uniref:transmembrane protein 62 n=1 Tax=Penaeus vannamei TaxID=6689 RepID=UPI00387F96DF
MQIDAVSPCKEMVRFWLRVLTPRGRRIYLVLASGLFLLSISLLVARSWKLKSAAGNFLYHEELQRTAEEIGSSFYYEPHKEAERVFSHKESKGGLTWFVQVSDIHLRLGAEEEVQQFREFVEDAVTILKPAAVLVTGDLTNSKTYGVKLKEIPQEWAIYKHSVRDRLNVNVSTLWLDIAGNHDNFDEVNHSHFKSHAVQVSIENTQTARRIIVTDGDGRNITLIPVDASLKPGIRAYNFLGYLPDHEFRELQRAAKDAYTRGDIVLFYGHYPTSTIITSRDLRRLLSGGTAYLCGHLHTGFSLADPMWTKHPIGLMELELADWAHHHRYRILSVDNGRVTWLDVNHSSWPVVLVSNVSCYPKGVSSIRYIVRLLVFSNEEVSAVSVRIDDNLGHWISCKHSHGPLYTAVVDVHTDQWEPQVTEENFVKNLQILIGNTSGSKTLLRIGTEGAGFAQPHPSRIGTIMLTINLHDAFMIIYVAGVGLCAVLLLLGKYQVFCQPVIPKKLMCAASGLAHNHVVFVHLLIFLFYPLIGPWYIGRLAGDKYGVVFMWGIFVDSSALPGELTYPDAFFLWVTLQLPVFILVMMKKGISLESARHRCGCWVTFCMMLIVLLQLPSILSWVFLDSLLLNGPLRLGLTAIAVSLWKRF